MAEINLLKNELKSSKSFMPSFSAGGSMKAFYVVLSIFGLVILAYFGLGFYQSQIENDINRLEEESVVVELALSEIEESHKAAVAAQQRLLNLQVLLDNHVFWSNLFEELEDFTYTEATFTTMQVDNQSGNRLLTTGEVSTFTDLGKLMKGLLLSEYITEVELTNTGQSDSEVVAVKFGLDITFDLKLIERID